VFCEICFNISDAPTCPICRDLARDGSRLCVVEEPLDVLALERTGEFKGRYHVLHGAISPIDGVGPDRLRIRELLGRVDDAARAGTPFEEVVLATRSDPRRRGDRDVPGRSAWVARSERSPGSLAASPSVATSSTPTRSP
jgi:recombination protein RecR